MSDVQDETPSSWTVDTLRVFLSAKISDLNSLLQERYLQQTKAVDAAYASQQTAMQTAKTEQSVAMITALAAQKEALNTAMAASEKAVAKAETAADKRFEESNGYRQQLQHQAQTFATKEDVDIRLQAIADKNDLESHHLSEAGSGRDKAIAALDLKISHRLDINQGQELGTNDARGNRRLDSSLVVSIISVVFVLVSVAITIFTLVSK